MTLTHCWHETLQVRYSPGKLCCSRFALFWPLTLLFRFYPQNNIKRYRILSLGEAILKTFILIIRLSSTTCTER